jgi:small subunit ribosomal protein S18
MIRRVVGIRGGNPNNNNNNPTDALQSLLSLGDTRRSGRGPVTAEEQREIMEQQQQANNARLSVRDLRNSATTDNFLSYMPRRWKAGDVYSPRDLSPVEQKKWTKRQAPLKDIVDLLGFNPLDNYKVCLYIIISFRMAGC